MSREIVTFGQPFSVAFLDRSFGGGPAKDIVNVDGGSPDSSGSATQPGNIRLGGRTVLGDATVVSTTGGASNTATLQLKDCAGNNHAGVRRVFAWVSATAGATSVGTDVTGLTTSVTTGVAITAVAGNLSVDCLTTSNGVLVITLADAAGLTTRFVNFAVDGKVFSSAAIITPA